MVRAAEAGIAGRRGGLGRLAERIAALSPSGTLARGYALVSRADGSAVVSAAALSEGERVLLRLRDGARGARVEVSPVSSDPRESPPPASHGAGSDPAPDEDGDTPLLRGALRAASSRSRRRWTRAGSRSIAPSPSTRRGCASRRAARPSSTASSRRSRCCARRGSRGRPPARSRPPTEGLL